MSIALSIQAFAWSCRPLIKKAALHLDVVCIKLQRVGLLRRSLAFGRTGAGPETLSMVEIGFALTTTTAAEKLADVPTERPCEDGVQEGVAQRVDGVEQDQQELGVGDGDEGHPQRC